MSKNNIYFFSENVKYSIQGKNQIRIWLEQISKNEGKVIGMINVILCNDSYLIDINVKYLKHDFYTDIITFNYNENNRISGDIYISIDRIKENAKVFSVKIFEELSRVIIHGMLHLCGYNDKTKNEKIIMKEKEDHYLKLRK